ncbi:unnamed protein product [Arabis nemorensis]|uniref:PRA1 family protein n=1 Tax=Arabis nemorensis TaxID=586526 RepID=A0A565AV31_9BRAS|nr:unnamed protein product [Arabis nemorensis]
MDTINSSFQTSSGDDESTSDNAVYSSVPHFVILTIKMIVIGLLQSTPTKAEIRDPTVLCFLSFCLIYFVLLVQEAKLRRNQSLTYHFVRKASHFFGVAAVNILVSLISPIFALVVAIMCVFWFLFVTYYTKHNQNAETAVNQSDDPIPPV